MAFVGGAWTGLFQVRPCIFQQVTECVLIMQLQWRADRINLSRSNQAARGRSQTPRWCAINPLWPPASFERHWSYHREWRRAHSWRGFAGKEGRTPVPRSPPCRCSLKPTACLCRNKRPQTLHKRKKVIWQQQQFHARLWTSPNKLTMKEAIRITIT